VWCVAAGFRLYGNVVADDVDAVNYSQHLRELQNYVVPPTAPSAHAASANKLPLSSVMSLPDQAALRVSSIQLRSSHTALAPARVYV